VARWRASGLTGDEFAARTGIRVATLRWWSWRLGSKPRESEATALAAPVTFVEMTSAMRSEPLEVVLARGVRIRVPTDFDASAMERLLDVLESRR
jgi:hypothetical protein